MPPDEPAGDQGYDRKSGRYHDGPKRGYLMCVTFCMDCGVGVMSERAHDEWHTRMDLIQEMLDIMFLEAVDENYRGDGMVMRNKYAAGGVRVLDAWAEMRTED